MGALCTRFYRDWPRVELGLVVFHITRTGTQEIKSILSVHMHVSSCQQVRVVMSRKLRCLA